MQGPISSSSAQPYWQPEDRRQALPASAFAAGAGANVKPVGANAGAPAAFGSILRAATGAARALAPGQRYEIQAGDTLSAIAQRRLQELGVPSGGPEIVKAVEQLAAANALTDPNRIYAGAHLDLSVLGSGPSASAPLQTVNRASGQPGDSARPIALAVTRPAAVALRQAQFPQLQKTLDRAVERGYIDAGDRQAVEDRIVGLGRKYQFSPDDLATVALMESDGFNPRASNGRCHGILQFCEGSSSGAASVGFQGRASEILDKSVLSQLDLAERYFQDTRLGEKGPVSLVDLYLTVLTPAARVEQRPHAALDIAGRQAKALHVSGDRSQPITRHSILSGLLSHAQQRLDALINAKPGFQASDSRPSRASLTRLSAPLDGAASRPSGGGGDVPNAATTLTQGRQG